MQLVSLPFRARLTRRADGASVKGAAVTMTLSMPSMVMPSQLVACRDLGDGYYSGQGVFTMPGDWRVDTIARIRGRQVAKVTSWVEVRLAGPGAQSISDKPAFGRRF